MQQQKFRPMTVVSGNIRYMRIFAGVPVIEGDLSVYFFVNFRDKASNII